MLVDLARSGHLVSLMGMTPSPHRAFRAVCSCGAQWSGREADHRHPTYEEWRAQHSDSPEVRR